MSRTALSNPRRPARLAGLLRTRPVAAAAASLLLAGGSAQAQQAAQTVTVTGIRAAIE
jgi:hypothetical protein